ncbi:ATP-grasp domain-containing protein [Enterobacter bugandensis]|uniref:ATP-grasp domain-containing protein n=1 Tax=Enterobacter bugandensis TaxID=881260 RepID=UPI00200472E0|nr:ATP-grasp domain-containing protein [Enterobacter bugandensis]MCK6737172.1 ATP-grasp domain-containing protein [Enterobacter bugandensis]
MNKKIWLMEGLSSQRDIIKGIKLFAQKNNFCIIVYGSHRNERNEILSVADYSLTEPEDPKKRLQFIQETIQNHGIHHIHTGRNCQWFEEHRTSIESTGATLTTGATGVDWLTLADDKVTFARLMEQNGLDVVPSWRVNTLTELQAYLVAPPFLDSPVCVKPVTGIYGMGFWRFDDSASPMVVFNHPEHRMVNPQQYIAAASASKSFNPLVLMPYLPGPEFSVDILADKGEILAAVGRRKEGAIQYLVNEGCAFELACACARVMKADGLVNVQTRNDVNGNPLLLEANMRPSGGVGYTLHSGVNLPGLFAAFKLGLMSEDTVIRSAKNTFSPVAVRSITDVIAYPDSLSNRLN